MESKIYNQDGKQAGNITLPESVFGLPWNSSLVHQIVVAEAANKRNRVAHTKGRGEVRGGGKKPWRQKGTGRARHGSTRSPIWKGGGVTHGPTKEKVYEKKINKKMKAKALCVILSQKIRDNEVLFIDKINLKEAKTREAKKILENFSKVNDFSGILSKKNNSIVMTFWKKDRETERSFGNFSNLKIEELRNITPSTVLNYKYLIMIDPNESVEFIAGKLNKKAKNASVTIAASLAPAEKPAKKKAVAKKSVSVKKKQSLPKKTDNK